MSKFLKIILLSLITVTLPTAFILPLITSTKFACLFGIIIAFLYSNLFDYVIKKHDEKQKLDENFKIAAEQWNNALKNNSEDD